MRLALRLARRGDGLTSPNPMVGAVVVSPSGELCGRGWHRGPGTAHAEVLALTEAGRQARRATLFVNLEPCVHYGRTPPCVDAVVASGVDRVVCSMLDPDRRVSGRGVAALEKAGLPVDVGLLENEAADLNRPYVKHRTHGRPYVTLKVAASLDGRTSAADGSSRWITGERARLDAHRVRASADAICVGVGTVLKDDPALTVRGARRRRPVRRVVIDSLARTPPGARVLANDAPAVIYAVETAPRDRVKALEDAGAQVILVPSESGVVPVDKLLEHLAESSVMSLLVEGGPRLAGSFAAAGSLDRYLFYTAPKLLGGAPSGPVFDGWAVGSIHDARRLRIVSVRRLGDDLRVEAVPADQRPGPVF